MTRGPAIVDPVFDGFTDVRTLTHRRTYVAVADDGTPVVLKRLDDDCLHAGRLHPMIRDRLAKIRGLANPRLATLRGVERADGIAYLVWTYVYGRSVDELPVLGERQVIAVARGIVSAVERLHGRGLVHGAIHGRNLIVSSDGDVWLTDVSPYLYEDVADDATAVHELIGELADRHQAVSLRRAVDVSTAAGEDLRRLGQELAAVVVVAAEVTRNGPTRRWPWAVAGIVFSLAALAVASRLVKSVSGQKPAVPPVSSWHPPG